MKHHIMCGAIAGALCASLLAGCGASAVAGSPTKAPSDKTLKIGVRSSVVNFGYQDPDSGRFYGLGVDIGNELARRLGYTPEYVAVTSANRAELLESGQVDCVAAAYTITPERQEQFDFSPAYYHDTIRVLAENSTDFSSVRDLVGANIGVLQDTNAAAEVAAEMDSLGLLDGYNPATFETASFDGGVRFKAYKSYDDVIAALECGDVDAAAMDGSIARGYLTDERQFLSESFGKEDYGIATVKGSALSAGVSATVQAMLDDGTIDALIDKWD